MINNVFTEIFLYNILIFLTPDDIVNLSKVNKYNKNFVTFFKETICRILINTCGFRYFNKSLFKDDMNYWFNLFKFIKKYKLFFESERMFIVDKFENFYQFEVHEKRKVLTLLLDNCHHIKQSLHNKFLFNKHNDSLLSEEMLRYYPTIEEKVKMLLMKENNILLNFMDEYTYFYNLAINQSREYTRYFDPEDNEIVKRIENVLRIVGKAPFNNVQCLKDCVMYIDRYCNINWNLIKTF
jgi:hypothetical protein